MSLLITVAFGEKIILMVNYPQREALVDDHVSEDLPAFYLIVECIMVAAINLESYLLGCIFSLNQIVDSKTVDCYLSINVVF